jgi:hypothetical protein
VLLLARALHHCADLILLSAGVEQSKIRAARAPIETRELKKLFRTIKQSNPAAQAPPATSRGGSGRD